MEGPPPTARPSRPHLRSKLTELWLRVDLGTSPTLKKLLVEPMKGVLLPLVRPFRRPRILRGHNPGGPLSLTHLCRFRRDLVFPRKRFFSACDLEEPEEKIPPFRVVTEVQRCDTDLALVSGGPRLVRGLPRRGALVLPARVEVVLDLRRPWEEIRRGFRKSARELLRIYERKTYRWRISHDPVDFRRFYHETYLPTIQARHGAMASPISETAARVHFRLGFLFFLLEEGREIAAGLCSPEGKTLRLICDGLTGGNLELMRGGRLGALFIARFRWAVEQGYEAVSLLSAAPSLRDRLLRSKRRWGSRLVLQRQPQSHLWLCIRRLTPAVAHCLESNPLVVIDRGGELDALILVPDADALDARQRRKLRKAHETPGLRRILVCSTAPLADAPDPLRNARPL